MRDAPVARHRPRPARARRRACAPTIRRRCRTRRKLLPEVTLCKDAYEACEGADALVIVTEWNQFRMLDLERVKSLLRQPRVVDLRNVYEPEPMRAAGFPTSASAADDARARGAAPRGDPRRRRRRALLAGVARAPPEAVPARGRRPHACSTRPLARARRFAAPERVWVVCGARARARDAPRGADCRRARVLVEPRAAQHRRWRSRLAAQRIAAARSRRGAGRAARGPPHPGRARPSRARCAAPRAPRARRARSSRSACAPTRPETGYGYIRLGAPRGRGASGAAPRAALRREARRARARGATCAAAATSGTPASSCGRRARSWTRSTRYAPELARARSRRCAAAARRGRARRSRAPTGARPSLPIDIAVLERSRRVWTLPVRLHWSDVGTWESLAEELGVGAGRSAGGRRASWRLRRRAAAISCGAPGRLVALLGVEGSRWSTPGTRCSWRASIAATRCAASCRR